MNTTDTTLVVVLDRLLNRYLRMGMRDNIGHPLAVSSSSVLSIPPSRIISSSFTRMIDLYLLVEVGGGEVLVTSVVVKSVILTLMVSVTWSSPETTGRISMAILASTGVYCWVTTVCVLSDPSTFWVEVEKYRVLPMLRLAL